MDTFKYPNNSFGCRLKLVDEFTEIVSSAFGTFIDQLQEMFA